MHTCADWIMIHVVLCLYFRNHLLVLLFAALFFKKKTFCRLRFISVVYGGYKPAKVVTTIIKFPVTIKTKFPLQWCYRHCSEIYFCYCLVPRRKSLNIWTGVLCPLLCIGRNWECGLKRAAAGSRSGCSELNRGVCLYPEFRVWPDGGSVWCF